MKKEKIKESDLAKFFIDYLENLNYDVFKEVPGLAGVIDIVAKKNDLTAAIEVKTSFNFAVIEQAYNNLKVAHYSYVAIPRSKRYTFALEICKKFGIGVMVYDDRFRKPLISILNEPVLNPNPKHLVKTKDYMKRSVAGSQNNRVTEFQYSVEQITEYLHKHGDTHADKVLSEIDHHWSNINSAKQCMKQWCEKKVIKEFVIEKNILKLTQ